MHLNNKGVVLLDAGRHEEAISWFKTASKHLSRKSSVPQSVPSQASAVIAEKTNNTAPQEEEGSSSCAHASNSKIQAKLDSKSTFPVVEEKQQEDDHRKVSPTLKRQIISNSQQQSQKRRRSHPVDNDSKKSHTLCESANYVIGRPWWLTDGNMSSHTVMSLSSIVLYNLGLNYHLLGLLDQKATDENKKNLKRAMGIYEMAQHLACKVPSPILLLSLHNMSQINFHGGNHDQGNALSREVCKILRILHVGIDGYEKFYLRMLSLQSRILAPAA